jgi:hypothetical protein
MYWECCCKLKKETWKSNLYEWAHDPTHLLSSWNHRICTAIMGFFLLPLCWKRKGLKFISDPTSTNPRRILIFYHFSRCYVLFIYVQWSSVALHDHASNINCWLKWWRNELGARCMHMSQLWVWDHKQIASLAAVYRVYWLNGIMERD